MHTCLEQIAIHRWACICLALLATGPFAAGVQAEDYSKSYTVSNRASVHVDTNDGNVQVTAVDNTKQVEFRVEYRGLEIDETLHIESHQQGDEVVLTARFTGKSRFSALPGAKLYIDVRMPKDGDLRVETGDGSVRANDLSGAIDLRSGDGNLSVHSLTGDVRLHTGDGFIDGSNLDGRCDAASGDGRIRVDGRFDVLKVTSGDGSISVGARHGSRFVSTWDIGSGDGRIDVALPSDLPVDIDASTRDGHIRSDLPITVEGNLSRSRVHGKMNGGGQTFTIHSGDGSIHLKQV